MSDAASTLPAAPPEAATGDAAPSSVPAPAPDRSLLLYSFTGAFSAIFVFAAGVSAVFALLTLRLYDPPLPDGLAAWAALMAVWAPLGGAGYLVERRAASLGSRVGRAIVLLGTLVMAFGWGGMLGLQAVGKPGLNTTAIVACALGAGFACIAVLAGRRRAWLAGWATYMLGGALAWWWAGPGVPFDAGIPEGVLGLGMAVLGLGLEGLLRDLRKMQAVEWQLRAELVDASGRLREAEAAGASEAQDRPPFAFLWSYIGAWSGNITWEDYTPVDTYLAGRAPAIVDLPLAVGVRHVATEKMRLFPSEDAAFVPDEPLLWASIGFATGLLEKARVFGVPSQDPERVEEIAALVSLKSAMLDELRSMDWVPRLVRSKAIKLSEATKTLETKLGRHPTEQELALRMAREEETEQSTYFTHLWSIKEAVSKAVGLGLRADSRQFEVLELSPAGKARVELHDLDSAERSDSAFCGKVSAWVEQRNGYVIARSLFKKGLPGQREGTRQPTR